MNTEIANYDFHGNDVRVLTDQDDAFPAIAHATSITRFKYPY